MPSSTPGTTCQRYASILHPQLACGGRLTYGWRKKKEEEEEIGGAGDLNKQSQGAMLTHSDKLFVYRWKAQVLGRHPCKVPAKNVNTGGRSGQCLPTGCNAKTKQDFVLSITVSCPCVLDESQTCNAKTNQEFVIGRTSDLRIYEQEGTLL